MDSSIQNTSIMLHFSVLPDPRKPRNQLYTIYGIMSTVIRKWRREFVCCEASDFEFLAKRQDYKGELERTTAEGIM